MDARPAIEDPLAVRRALSQARAAWPKIDLSEEAFARYLQTVGALPEALEGHGVDLALACACAGGDEQALAVFESVHVACISLHVLRLRLSDEQLDELRQMVRVRLFAGPSPRILRYSGKGPLGAWLRILSIRVAMNELQANPRETQVDPKTFETFVAGASSASGRIDRGVWQPRLREVVEACLSELPPREKTILRLHYIEGLNIDAIGTLYQVHRATVARWLLAIREVVLTRIRKTLALTSPATTSEIRGVFADLDGELRVSISRVLGPAPRSEP